MTARRDFRLVALTALLTPLLLPVGSARASIITRFEGQFSASNPNFPGRNTAISVAPAAYVEGTGQKTFFLNSGTVSSTTDPSAAFVSLGISDLVFDISEFSDTNPFCSIFNAAFTGDLLVGAFGSIFADFTMAPNASITSDPKTHTATLTTAVTLNNFFSPGDNLNAFNTSGGGQFIIEVENVDIIPTNDGKIFFPVNPNQLVTIHWQIVATPAAVPEPSS